MVINKLNNQNGITLVEVLAVLVISSIVMTLIWGIFMNGTNATQRTQQKTETQHEANFVSQTLRMHHQSGESYKLQVSDSAIHINGETVSQGYTYTSNIHYEDQDYLTGDVIDVTTKSPLRIQIELTDKNDQSREIRTTIQKEGE